MMTNKKETVEKITVCEYCKKDTCECKYLVCPIHGKVIAVKSNENYNCKVSDCAVTRAEKELEP